MTTTSVCPTETVLEALLQMTASGLDADEDDEFISFHLNSIIQAFLTSMKNIQSKEQMRKVRLCLKCLINFTGNQNRCILLHKFDSSHLSDLVSHLSCLLLNTNIDDDRDTKEMSLCELAASLICNLTREDAMFLNMFVNAVDINKLIHAIVQSNNKENSDKLPQVLLNLSQDESVRFKLCCAGQNLIQSLISFTRLQFNTERRAAIAGLIKNCCFNDDYHSYLLSKDVDLLSALIIPLSGPDDIIDDEDRASLPPASRGYPGDEDTVREPDANIRICHCQSILQLCSTPECRSLIKACRVYAVLRELHKWERDSAALLAIEQVVDILIGDDPPEELSHLRNINVPEEMAKNIDKSNRLFVDKDT